MNKPSPDLLASLLQEWRDLPEPAPWTGERVLVSCRRLSVGGLPTPVSSGPLWLQPKALFVCLCFGVLAGAAYAEWVTLRREDNALLAQRYLASIDPSYQPGSKP